MKFNVILMFIVFTKVMNSLRFQGQKAQPKALPVIKLYFLRPFNYKNIISCRNQTHADKLTFMLTGQKTKYKLVLNHRHWIINILPIGTAHLPCFG